MQSKPVSRPTQRALLRALMVGACLAAGSAAHASAPQAAPTAAQGQLNLASAAAQRDLAQFVQHTLRTRASGLTPQFPLDVADLAELKEARVAYGFQVHTVDPKELLEGRSELRNMAKPTSQWRFVIAVNGKPVGMSTVEHHKGKWETVAYGAAVLAKDVDASMAAHGNAERSNVRFIRVYQAKADFLEVMAPNDSRAKFAPLHSARESLAMAKDGKAPGALVDADDFLGPLRSAVKTNMDAFR